MAARGLLTVLCAAAGATGARADGLDASVGYVSNQFVRGVTTTENHPAALANLAWRTDTGWSTGLELSRARGNSEPWLDDATLLLQHGWQLDADWATQLGYARYLYFGGAPRRAFDRDELSATAAWRGRWTATVMGSPNMLVVDADGPHHRWTTSYSLGWRERWIGRLAVDAGIGYQAQRGLVHDGYAYGSAGLSGGLGPVQASVTRIFRQASLPAVYQPQDVRPRWVAAVFWSF